MSSLTAAHSGYFPAKTIPGIVWVLIVRRQDGVTELYVNSPSGIPVTEWQAWARTVWPATALSTPAPVDGGWVGSAPTAG